MVQKLKKWVCTTPDRPGTKTEIIIVTINVKVNPEDDTLTVICCSLELHFSPDSRLFYSEIKGIEQKFGIDALEQEHVDWKIGDTNSKVWCHIVLHFPHSDDKLNETFV